MDGEQAVELPMRSIAIKKAERPRSVPWRQPFKNGSGGGLPKNLISYKEYRGINVFLLAVTAWVEGYDSSYWLTFKQAKERNAHVRKGEKGSLVIFWKQYATEDKKTGDPISIPVMRHYTLFNAQPCERLEPPAPSGPELDETPFEPIIEAMVIVAGYKDAPHIEHGGRLVFVYNHIPGQFENHKMPHQGTGGFNHAVVYIGIYFVVERLTSFGANTNVRDAPYWYMGSNHPMG